MINLIIKERIRRITFEIQMPFIEATMVYWVGGHDE